jgi:hypothetical protein
MFLRSSPAQKTDIAVVFLNDVLCNESRRQIAATLLLHTGVLNNESAFGGSVEPKGSFV